MRRSLILISLIAAGCASSGTTPPSTDRILAVDDRINGGAVHAQNDVSAAAITLSAPADEIFAAVASTYAMLKLPVTYNSPATGEQGNRKFVMNRIFDHQPVSSYMSCGDDPFGGPNANSNPVAVSIVTRVRPVGGTNSVLETTLTGSTSKASTNSGTIYCASTGALELHIAEMVKSRLDTQH
jgi:hypothetical protein